MNKLRFNLQALVKGKWVTFAWSNQARKMTDLLGPGRRVITSWDRRLKVV